MKVLFVHNNFPAQYRNLAAALAKEPGNELVAIGAANAQPMPSVRLLKYALAGADVSATHPFARRFDLECRRAEQVLYSLSSLAASGFSPDVILAHPGWGETLPLRTMFPKARIILYCEFFYGAQGRDLGFDPEFPTPGLDGHIGLHLKNATTLLALEDCDIGVSPTSWQHSTFPTQYQNKIEIVHEGIDTALVKPKPLARLRLPDGRELNRNDEVVTFVARNLEPLRGYHIFMRALPKILARRPQAQVVIIGGDGLSYGLAPPAGTNWKTTFLNEVRSQLDLSRVHFMGRVSYETFLTTLQVSSAHVYLTYPFVLSWSMLEAMSAGCVVIGSDTAPVREVLQHGDNGMLVPFHAVDELADRVSAALKDRDRMQPMREAARRYVIEHFDAERVCVPKMRSLLAAEPPRPPSRRFWPGRMLPPWERRGKAGADTGGATAERAETMPAKGGSRAGGAEIAAKRIKSSRRRSTSGASETPAAQFRLPRR
ncbi:Glycosyl transferase, group 1 [Bradyrhizobium sp. ORS 375]|uniref:glycosyltransferase family 4 protein n=1 Tax=Bradyrhizobium sp. (strain ORS 375) TaxID=566679 RepID=UPI000240ACF2|nr:Glycosyl transferase, group 1 [Bradyrhizobium sp. ORS 375]